MRARVRQLGLALAVMLGGACAAPPTPAATPVTLTIAATDLTAPLVQDLAAAYRAAIPAVVIAIHLVPQTELAVEVATGRAALGLTTQTAAGPFVTPIGAAPLHLVIAAGPPLPALSRAQARGLWAGQITDWAQVGGPAGPVQIVTREAGADAALAWLDALDAPAAAPNAWIAPTWAAMRELVGQTPGAVGYLPASELDASLQAVPLDAPLMAPVAAVALTEPTGPARDFLAWAQSPAGQAVVSQRHLTWP